MNESNICRTYSNNLRKFACFFRFFARRTAWLGAEAFFT
jgi:hypothetical protein